MKVIKIIGHDIFKCGSHFVQQQRYKMKKLIAIFIFTTTVCVADPNWNSYEMVIAGTPVVVNEYKVFSEDKVLLLPGGDGIIPDLEAFLETNTAIAAAYAAVGKQAVSVSLPYYSNGRNTVAKASQNVLNIIDAALNTGYLGSGYTLVAGSGGTLIVSAMLDFNQIGDSTGCRLIDHVGRVVLVAGPHNNEIVLSPTLLDLMEQYDVNSLITLDPLLTFGERCSLYLCALDIRIVIGDDDNILCASNERCEVSMDLATNRWMEELTGGLFTIYDLPNTVLVVPDAGHSIPLSSYQNFIMD